MGTETRPFRACKLFPSSISVKLNNPLMGTETCHTRHDNLQYIRRVKLNNPLMGTETLQTRLSYHVIHGSHG